jgi:hypothetical protein
VSDLLLAQIVTMVGTLGTALITGLVAIQVVKLNIKAAQANAKVDVVAEKTEEVRTTLAHTQGINAERLDSIHKLVNSHMREQLRINADALADLAAATGTVTDEARATASKKLLNDHDAAQKASEEAS